MGNAETLPISQAKQDIGYVAIVLRRTNKVRIIYDTPQIKSVLYEIVRQHSYGEGQTGIYKYGTLEFKLPGAPFLPKQPVESATTGKKFVCQLLDKMFSLGYDFVVSSDLTRQTDQSTLFFQKVCGERPQCKILCVAPGGYDKIVIMNEINPNIINAVAQAISQSWPGGTQNTQRKNVLNQQLYEIKLRGNPWFSAGDESVAARQLLATIIQNLSKIGWQFHAGVNIKGGTDTMFFIQIPHEEIKTSVVSFNRQDRLRLIGFDSSFDPNIIGQCINQHYQSASIQPQNYCGATEFKLKGYPFHCSGMEAIKTRRLIVKVLETLQNYGWSVLTGLDVSRKDHDKSIITLIKSVPKSVPFACIALSDVDKIRIIDFPAYEQERLAEVIRSTYAYGIQLEKPIDEKCLQFKLQGSPWVIGNTYGTQARAMLTNLLKKANELGWQLSTSLDVSAKFIHQENGPDYPIDVHSWFFCKTFANYSEDFSSQSVPSAPPMGATSMGWNFNDTFSDLPPSYDQVMNT